MTPDLVMITEPEPQTEPKATRIPTWAENGVPLTLEEKTSLIHDYQRAREHDVRGVTASGLAVYIKERGVLLQKGCLGSRFLERPHFKVTPDGVMNTDPEPQTELKATRIPTWVENSVPLTTEEKTSLIPEYTRAH